MFPLFRGNYFIMSKIHSNSPSIITYNIRIMIIFLIWNLLLIISLMHSFCKIISFFSFLWIFILFILPIFWHLYSIIPKIVTNCITIFIPYLLIMLVLFIWYHSILSLNHSLSLSIFIFFRIIIILI